MVTKNSQAGRQPPHLRLKKGDTVKILRGKDKGKTGKIIGVVVATRKVIVDGANMVKKHIKPKRAGEKGQRVSIASPINVANVQLICPACKRATKVAIKRDEGRRQRVCKKCAAIILP